MPFVDSSLGRLLAVGRLEHPAAGIQDPAIAQLAVFLSTKEGSGADTRI
jgi:hypothetical protein